MKNSFELLVDSKPIWVRVLNKKAASLDIEASSQKPSGAPGKNYKLTITHASNNRLKVAEHKSSTTLPKCCVERHINPGASFCLYFNSSHSIKSIHAAERWWVSLGEFLNNQDYATKHGRWPRDKGLSHGDAAQVQIQMEELATPLEWKDEILDSIFRNQGWLSGKLMQRQRNGRGFVNLRMPCPRKCKQLHFPFQKMSCTQTACNTDCKKSHPNILRVSCPNRDMVEKLTSLEYKRRALEEKLIKEIRKSGIKCCGTMKDCALARVC